MDFQPENVIENLKKNKLAIPAIGIGLVAGIYLLYKSNQTSSVLTGTPTDNGVVPSTTSTPDTSGSSSSDSQAVTDLQNQLGEVTAQQQNLASSFQQALNQLSDSLFGQLNQQQQVSQPVSQSSDYIPNELDAINRVFSQQYSQLHDLLNSAVTVPDFANISPVIHSDISKPDNQVLQLSSDISKVVSNIGKSLFNTVQQIQQPVIQPVVNNSPFPTLDISHAVQGVNLTISKTVSNIGNVISNVVSNIQYPVSTPNPNFNTQSYLNSLKNGVKKPAIIGKINTQYGKGH